MSTPIIQDGWELTEQGFKKAQPVQRVTIFSAPTIPLHIKGKDHPNFGEWHKHVEQAAKFFKQRKPDEGTGWADYITWLRTQHAQ